MKPAVLSPPRFIDSPAFLLLILSSLFLVGALPVGCGGEVPPAPAEEIPSLDGERINSYYTNEEIQYFLAVAIGDTSDQSRSDDILRTKKWLEDIRISLKGHPTPEDSAMVRQVVEELNRHLYEIDISISDNTPNVTMYFVPPSEFHLVEPASQPGEPYQAWVYWTGAMVIYKASILIPSDSTTEQFERDPMILNNTAAILGFLDRSLEYPESIFYYWWNWANHLAPVDKKIIEILYLPEVHPGMTRKAAIKALANR